MYFSTLASLIFAASAFGSPLNQARTAPSSNLVIRGVSLTPQQWNTTTFDCSISNPHLWGEMGPSEDTWGDGGLYGSYSLDRDLAANETLQLYGTSGGNYCGTLLYPVSGVKAGCYQTSGTGEVFSCVKMVTASS